MQLLAEIDLVQAEWIVTAFAADDARMKEVVYKELDPHVRTGMLISGAPERYVLAENALVGHLSDPNEIAQLRNDLWNVEDDCLIDIDRKDIFHPRSMSIRQAGKKSNHGLNYGLGAGTFALTNDMEEADARKIIDNYRNIAYPGLKRYYSKIENQLNQTRTLKNCFGDKRRFLDEWGPNFLMAAYSYIPQSTVAHITNRGMSLIYYDETYEMRNTHLCANVHDSVLVQIEFDRWPQAAEVIARCDSYFTLPFEYCGEQYTLRRDVKIGRNWGEAGMHVVQWGKSLAHDLQETWEANCAQETQ